MARERGDLICGASGPEQLGKTTSLKAAAGLLAPSSGALVYVGAPERRSCESAARAVLSALPQRVSFPDAASVPGGRGVLPPPARCQPRTRRCRPPFRVAQWFLSARRGHLFRRDAAAPWPGGCRASGCTSSAARRAHGRARPVRADGFLRARGRTAAGGEDGPCSALINSETSNGSPTVLRSSSRDGWSRFSRARNCPSGSLVAASCASGCPSRAGN